MAAVLAYTLPTMQLVCHLVTLGNSGVDVTTSVPVTTQLAPQHQAIPLPDGYVAYPDVGFAYKYHPEEHTWIPARNVCLKEGAQLAVIDSAKKMNYLGQIKPDNWFLSGIIRMDTTWINVNTGEPIPESAVWKENRPDSGSGDCAQFSSYTAQGLCNFNCRDSEDFFCEIPILANSTITDN